MWDSTYSYQFTSYCIHPTEYSQEVHYYPFAVKLDRCVESCNALNDLPNKVCVPNKTENFNLRVFNMITGINESKTLTMHISCKSKCDCMKCDSNQKWNNDNCLCEFKNPRKHHMYKKYFIWNPATCSCKKW